MTPKQSRLIVHLIETHQSEAVKRIFQNQPKNNAKYPDERADYRRMIFAEALEKLNHLEADFLIKSLRGDYSRNRTTTKMMRLLFEHGLVPPMPHPETGVDYDDN